MHVLLSEFMHVQRNVRVAAVKGFHQRPDQVGRESWRHRYLQRSSMEIAHIMDRTLAFPQLLRRPQCIAQVNLPGLGQARFAP